MAAPNTAHRATDVKTLRHPLRHPPQDRNMAGRVRRPRGRDPWWAKAMVITGALLAMLSGLAIGSSQLLFSRVERSVTKDNLLGDAADSAGDPLSGPLNILLVGTDAGSTSRADSIIVLHVNASHDRGYLVSIPRDLLVDVKPFPKSGYRGGQAKINEAFFHGSQGGAGRAGGMQLLAATIRDTLGITFDAAAIINFDGFKAVIDALGGVDMCFDQDVTSKHLVRGPDGQPINIENDPDGHRKGSPITYKKGECRHLAAWEALDYSRQRYGLPNSDYDRQRHQQQLIRAMVKKATSKGVITNPSKVNAVIRAAGAALVIDTGVASFKDFVFTLRDVNPNKLVTVKTNAGKFNSIRIGKTSYEQLTPASMEMFQALRDDALDEFLARHPEFLGEG